MNDPSSSLANTSASRLPTPSEQPTWLLVIFLAIAFLTLRLPLPQLRPMWADEAYSVTMARHSLPEIWEITFRTDAHPPGYYALLHLWSTAFGDSLLSMRILSDLVVLAAIIITFFAMRRLVSEKAAWVTALLMTVSPFVCRLDEARNYCTMFLCGALALLVLSYAYRRRDWTAWLWAAVLITVGLHFSYNALQVGLGLGLAMLWLFRHHGRQLAVGLLVFVALLALVLPHILGSMAATHEWARHTWYHPEPWPHLIKWGVRRSIQGGVGVLVGFHHHVWMELMALVALLATFGVLIGSARRGLRIAGHRLGTYALLLVVVAFPGWLLWSAATIADRTLMMTSAYYTSVVPALYALVALGLAHGRRGAVWGLAVTALVVGMAGGHGLRYYNAQHQVDWGEIMSFIDARQEPGDVIAVSPPYVQMQAQHHHHGSTPVTGVPRDFDITRHRASLPEIRLTPDKLPAAIQRLSAFNRVWFIETRRQRIDPDRTIYQALGEAGREIDLGLTEAPGHLQGNVILFEMPAGSSTDELEGGR